MQQEQPAKDKLAAEIEYITAERDEMVNDTYIHDRDYWIQLRKFQSERVELLKLCKKAQAVHLARLVLVAYAYAPELATLAGRPLAVDATGPSMVKVLRNILKQDNELHKAFYGLDSDGNIAALESKLASRSLRPQEQPVSMEE